ncbi:MAG: WD40 repeat domain-containing protein [Pseudomonadota bacterium]
MQSGLTAEAPPKPNSHPTDLERRGERFAFGAPVTGAVTTPGAVAVSFGDGMVRFFRPDEKLLEVQAHSGVVLCIAADGDHVLTGGDDGRCLRISPKGDIEELATFGTRWVDCVAASHGHRACSSGRTVHLFAMGDRKAVVFEHPSTVGGLAFDSKGKRLAVTHYGGATIWAREKRWKSKKLIWEGFHGQTTFSPDGKFLVTAMQENTLHAWRLRGKGGFTMPGYKSKIKSLVWVGEAPHLVTSGEDEAIAWPFDGKDGPTGRKPVCVAYNDDELVSALCPLPGEEAVFAGFRDGMVQLAELDHTKPAFVVSSATGAEVTAIALVGLHIVVGDANGSVLWAPLKAGERYARNV